MQGGIVLVNNSSESPTYHQNPNEQNMQDTSQAATPLSELVEEATQEDNFSDLELPGGPPESSVQPMIETNGSRECTANTRRVNE